MRSLGIKSSYLAVVVAVGLLSARLQAEEYADPAVAVIQELLAAHEAKSVVKQVAAEAPTHIALADKKTPVDPIAQLKTQPNLAQVTPPAPAPAAQDAPQAPPAVVPPQPPVVVTPPATPREPAVDPINDVLQQLQDRQNQDLELARSMLTDAKAAAAKNDLVRAMRLALGASKLAPEDQQIRLFMSELRARNAQHRLATTSYSRAKAHLAAGLTRGQELMARFEYREGQDLLDGVVRAADLFPSDARVDIYRDQAQKELRALQAAIDAGKIVLEPMPEETASGEAVEPILVATGAQAPVNIPRLLKGSEAFVPAWYTMQKNLLARNMTVSYRSTPVSIVLDDISKATGVKFVVDEPVAQAHATMNGTVDLRVGELPAERILDIACLKGGVEYVIMEKAVVVTTASKAIDYVRQLPRALKENWAFGRVLFPSLNPELFATPLPTATPATEEVIVEQVPEYLVSGQALVDDITKLLR